MSSAPRRTYIDWARGVAVLVMIEAHALDAWTRAASRHGVAFRNATILGGFAAPLFLWLAGLSVVLSASGVARRQGSRAAGVSRVFRRGVEILLLAYLFRLQAFVISPGNSPLMLFRVDILNVMGPAIAVAALVWGVSASPGVLVALYAALAAATAMAAPLVREWPLVDALPLWLQWYMRPAGEFTNFTLFPWAGFVFAGGAVGVLLAPVGGAARERTLNAAFAGAGVLLVGLGFYTAGLPSIYHASSFWTSSPTFFAIRVGVMMVAFAALYGLADVASRVGVRLAAARGASAGTRCSCTGSTSSWSTATRRWIFHHRLPLWGTFTAYVLFSVAMYWAVRLEERVLDKRRRPPVAAGAPEPAPA